MLPHSDEAIEAEREPLYPMALISPSSVMPPLAPDAHLAERWSLVRPIVSSSSGHASPCALDHPLIQDQRLGASGSI